MKGEVSTNPHLGSYAWARAQLAERGKLSSVHVILLVKRYFPPDLRGPVIKALPGTGKRGRKPTRHPAQVDFHPAFPMMLAEYRRKFAEYKAEHTELRAETKSTRGKLPRAEPTPAERAWAYVHAKYGPLFGIRTVETLRNVVSKTFRKLPDCPAEFEEIEANWRSQQSGGNSHDGSRRSDRVQTHTQKRKDAK